MYECIYAVAERVRWPGSTAARETDRLHGEDVEPDRPQRPTSPATRSGGEGVITRNIFTLTYI